MLVIAEPIPKKRLKNSREAKSGAKNQPSVPTPKSATPSRNKSLCLNLRVKKPMIKPAIRPKKEPTVKIWLTVPTATFSVEEMFTIALLRKTVNVYAKKKPKSKANRNNRLLRLFSAAGCVLLMLFYYLL